MIKIVIFIMCGIFILLGISCAIDIASDEPYDDAYDYCRDCKYGFCAEYPKTEDCQRWKEEGGDET